MSHPRKIIVTTAHMECCMCPTVIAGTTSDGETIRARYRWGRLVIRLDPPNLPCGGAAGAWIMDQQLDPEGLAGFLSYEEIKDLTDEMIQWPDELSPMPPDQTDDDQSWLGPPNPLDL